MNLTISNSLKTALCNENPSMRLYFMINDNTATEEQYNEYMNKYAEQAEIEMGKPVCKMNDEEFDIYRVLSENLKKGKLKGDYCKLCRNKGYIVRKEGSYIYYADCTCMKKRVNERILQTSEYYKLLTTKTFENYSIKKDFQRLALQRCKNWLKQDKYPFLFLGGQTGAGKTHLGIASLVSLSRRGDIPKLVSWQKESRALKMNMTEYYYYEPKLEALKNAPLLMVDDFLWTNENKMPSNEDWKIAKEIIDARGENRKRTIFTCNMALGIINTYSEVVGGRLMQYTGGKSNFDIEFGFGATNYRTIDLIEIAEETPFEKIVKE